MNQPIKMEMKMSHTYIDEAQEQWPNQDEQEDAAQNLGVQRVETKPSSELQAAPYTVGQKVHLLKDVWDDGADHHPPGYLAHKGELLIVRKIDPGHEFPVCVSHEHITDRSFRVALDEIALANGVTPNESEGEQ